MKKNYSQEYFQKHTDHYLKQDLNQIPSFAWIKKELDLKPGEKVLDAGCGTGYLLDFVCGKRLKGVGIDISNEAIKIAKKLFPRHCFVKGNITSLPFKDKEFDKIVCFNTIEHIKKQKKAIKEFKRVLKKDGVLIIGTNDKNSLSWRLFSFFLGGDPTHIKEFGTKEFLEFIGNHFEIVEWTKSSCIARFPMLINRMLNLFLKGDILVKAIK